MDKIEYKLVGDRVEVIREVVVHEFLMSDVEDPDIWAGESLHRWAQSEKGQWVIQNAHETPVWHRMDDFATMGHKYIIKAKFMGVALTEWLLRYGNR